VKRSIVIVAAIAGLVICAPTALADDSNADTSAASPPATQTPATEVPATEIPATQVPATETPATTVPATTEVAATTDVPVTAVTTTVPGTGIGDDIDACVADCIPVAADTCMNCIPSAGGGIPHAVAGAGSLPFTGIEDTIAPLLLALVVVLGGVVAWRWAQLRESVATDADRARPLPAREARSGYAAAIRRNVIEQRARQVFTPRVA
jgi:hypothetical protein